MLRRGYVTLGCIVCLMLAGAAWGQAARVAFTDVTEQAGIDFRYTFGDFTYDNILESSGSGVTVFDYDGDGDLDLFQANDHQENFLFQNNGNGRLHEVAEASGVVVNDQGTPTGSMHGTIGDVDGDGWVDILVVDLSYGALYRNLGNGLFEDIEDRSGIKHAFTGKGAWAAALFDYDNDGDLDIVVSHIDLRATAALLRNDGGNANHWLGVTLVGNRGPASAIGAKVTAQAGGRTLVRVNQPGASYLSYNDPRVHFGLGGQGRVDRLEVRWPDGRIEAYRDLPADRYLTIVQGAGIARR